MLPHVKVLKKLSNVSNIILVTIERDSKPFNNLSDGKKVTHISLKSKSISLNLLNKVSDFVIFLYHLKRITKLEHVDKIVAFGSLAGGLALAVNRMTAIPFYVAYYEPHALYMLESKVWKFFDIRYLFQHRWDNQQALNASGLITVSHTLYDKLISEGDVDPKLLLRVQNGVELELFTFNHEARIKVRQTLNFQSATIGIYVGKFGDLYYKEEAFEIYKKCFELIPNFRLIILSPQPKAEILQLLQEQGVDTTKVHIASVPHHEVPAYLSAADFAFATYKPGPSKKYLSPIKIGEYWANGLPVLLTEGIGDDSEIIEREGGGALFNLHKNGSVEHAIVRIMEIMKDPGHRQEIPKLAHKYRSPERIKEAYEYFFGNGQEVKE
ncbi:glycosyltransferase [Pontibacter sp. MBLB2868]|uniref:glycosyltransferase n=1 Tax=Pontibacter sp. MBLB2868 TaxID=3451555 RepID=UPI003F753379